LPAYRWSPFLRNHDQPRTRTELGNDWGKARLAAALLLTLPGLPFIYYGEELGMTGPKPDQLIRTPMGWTADGPHAGFTTGTPWERMRDDSLTANVAVQAADPTSLLALYRRLIHLRAAHPALATGTLIPLDTGSDAALAFVRRDGSRAVIVVANLGGAPLTGVALGSDVGALPPGRYHPRDALGAGAAAPLEIGPNGRMSGYVPLPVLAPMTAFVLDLTPAR
ncbi:MAG: alpha-amylase family glycosyl hydrolase, partial [Gemmatimonadota bacterium]